MADVAKQTKLVVEFEWDATIAWLELEGRKHEKTGEWIQMPLNDDGKAELEKYRKSADGQAFLKAEGHDATEFPVSIGFPVIKGGFEQYLPEEVLKAWNAEWHKKVLTRFAKMELRLDADFVGNTRIRINRLATPIAYAKFCQPFPTKKGGSAKTNEKAAGFTSI